MMGLVKSNQGTIKMFDQFVHQRDEGWKKEVAYQPQTTIGSDAFTGKALKDLVSHFYPNWDEDLFTKVVQLLDIHLNKRFGKLSQGSQQKLNFALTIARNAPLLILDEPTAHIDLLRSEEHTSELQSRGHLVCRLLLEKKKHQHLRQIQPDQRPNHQNNPFEFSHGTMHIC